MGNLANTNAMITLTIKENDSDHAFIKVEGEFDTAASEYFSQGMNPIMEDAGKEIILDFSELSFISSSGLRLLLILNKNVLAQGGKVVINGMNKDIRNIFHLTGFDSMFKINS